VIECEPAANEEVVKDACPFARLSMSNVAVPSWRVTVPVGVPAPGAKAVTITVKVTPWPNTLGFAEEFRVTVAASLFTICDNGDELLELKVASPP
jgi:hypothetical protein